MNRRMAREKAMQILFQLNMNNNNLKQTIDHFIKDHEYNPYFSQLIEGVFKYLELIDHMIEENLENWTLDRLAAVDRTILRIAVYEIQYVSDVPDHVAINEAVELAKKYGEEKSGSFVNGVLSKII